MTRPIVPLLTAFASGVIFSRLWAIPDLPVQVCLIVSMLLILRGVSKKWSPVHRFALLCSLFALGILEMNLSIHPHVGSDHIIHQLGDGKTTAEGIVGESPQVSSDKTELIITASRILDNGQYRPASGRLLLTIREPALFRYGDVIRFRAKLRSPHNFQNPGGFDYEQYLRFRGILVSGFINDRRDIITLRRDMGNPLRSRLEKFRDSIRETIMTSAPGTEGAIIRAMILGDQKEIPKEVMEKFNKTGTTHIIAISGFNIGIVAAFAILLVRLMMKASEYILLRWDITRISTLFSILTITLYTFIAGSGISVIRASIMVVLFMFAILVNRERDLYNTLAAAAFCILIISPSSLFDVSFQLSFTAVASLLFLTPKLVALLPPHPAGDTPTLREEGQRRIESALRAIVIFFFASLSATVGTLPFILLYFNRLSLVALAANFIVVPVLGIIAIPFCLLIVIAAPVSAPLADIIIRISAHLVRVSLSLVDWFSALPWSSVYVTTPTLIEIGAFYLLIGSVGYWLDRWGGRPGISPLKELLCGKVMPACLIFFLIGNAIHLHLRGLHHGRLSLTAIDVGQGSAILIRFPGGKRMLVDGGGFFDETFDVGKYVLAPFFWHERIDLIDVVALTHPHPDHLQGLLFILENFDVREVWTNGQEVDLPLYRTFRDIIHGRSIPLKILSDRTPEYETSGVSIQILNPPSDSPIPPSRGARYPGPADHRGAGRDEYPPGTNRIRPWSASADLDEINDGSLAMRISFGRQRFFLSGDISEKSERRLARSGTDLRSGVLFVPHHGGVHSSTMPFLEQVKPEVAVISCGFKNTFGFPHRDVIGRLERIQSRVYRTDRDGAITIVTDGNDLTTSVFRSGIP